MGTNGSTAGMLTQSQFKKGSVVVLTGAGTGLGREVAYKYAERGCPMVIHSLTQDEVDAVQQTCMEKFGNKNIHTFAGDMGDASICRQLIDFAISTFGRIDILFINHGIGAHHFLEDMTDEGLKVYKKVMDINYHSHVNLAHQALGTLKRSKG